MADEYSPSSPVNSNSPEVERDLIDGLHGAQEHDQSASEENEQASEIGCPCVSPKSFPFTTVVKRKRLKRLHKKELITSEECRSLAHLSFGGMLSLQLKKSADVRQKTLEELPWRIVGGHKNIIVMQKFELLSTFLSEDLITAEEAEEFSKVFTESNVRDSEYFVWKLVMRVCLHQSLDMCQKATALLEGSRLNTSASIRLLKVVPGLWQSECLSDDEYQILRPKNWTMSLTKVVALSAEKCKATIAAFKEAEVEPPELLLFVADLCHNEGLATIEEGKAIIENIYRWPDCVVNLQCWKEQETATGTIELLEKYKKLAEATVLRAVTSFHSEGLLSDDECRKACKDWIRSVIKMQYCKDAVIAEDSAVLLEKSGNEEAATALRVLSKLYQNDLLSKMDCLNALSRLGYKDLGSTWLFGIIKNQEMKSVDVVDATVDILERHHFNEYAKILQAQSQFHSGKLLEAKDRTYCATCEDWRVSMAKTLTLKPDNTRKKMLDILMELDCDELWWIAKEKELKLKIDTLKIDQAFLKSEASASIAGGRVPDVETERLKQQNLRLERELAAKKQFLLSLEAGSKARMTVLNQEVEDLKQQQLCLQRQLVEANADCSVLKKDVSKLQEERANLETKLKESELLRSSSVQQTLTDTTSTVKAKVQPGTEACSMYSKGLEDVKVLPREIDIDLKDSVDLFWSKIETHSDLFQGRASLGSKRDGEGIRPLPAPAKQGKWLQTEGPKALTVPDYLPVNLTDFTEYESTLRQLCWIPNDIQEYFIGPEGGTVGYGNRDAHLEFPPGALEHKSRLRFAILLCGPFQLPNGYLSGSVTVYINLGKVKLKKAFKLHLSTWFGGRQEHAQQTLHFARAYHKLTEGGSIKKYQFALLEGGDFISLSKAGILEIGQPKCLYQVVAPVGEQLLHTALAFCKEDTEEVRLRILFCLSSPTWSEEITTLYEKDEWKKHNKGPILFKFLDNMQPITAKLSAVNGPGWQADLEGGNMVNEGDITIDKLSGELLGLVEDKQYPPSVDCFVCYTSPTNGWKEVETTLLRVNLTGTDKGNMCFTCKVKQQARIMVKQELSVTPAASVTAQSRLHYSSATDTALSLYLHKKPILRDLMAKAIPRIGRQWNKVGLQLDMEDYLLDAIPSDDAENGGRQMFQQWLNGKKGSGGKPRTWESVLNAIEASIGSEVRKEVEAVLRQQN